MVRFCLHPLHTVRSFVSSPIPRSLSPHCRIWRKERHSATDVHFFTSHFYSTLAKGGPKAVTSWTAKKNIDIFTKKFIFIPINQSLHWSLCVVVNPGEIRNEIDECNIEVDDDSLFPCILFFDSLRAHRKNVIAKNVRNWLNSEWERLEKAKAPYEEAPFTNKTMKVFDPRGTFTLCLLVHYRISISHATLLELLVSAVPRQ